MKAGINKKRTDWPKEKNVYTVQCPILLTLETISGKWKLPILWRLCGYESVRYNELKRQVAGITNAMLTKCLRELEKADVISRKQYDEVPPRVEYALTKNGAALIPALKKLYDWGAKQIEAQAG